MQIRHKALSLIWVLWLLLVLAACSEEATLAPSPAPGNLPGSAGSSQAGPIVATTVAPNNPATPTTFAYKADKTFIFGLAQEPVAFNDQVGLDPANLTDHSSLLLTRQIYETLFQFKPSQMGYQNAYFVRNLVTSPDGLIYNIRLLKGIRFSDGKLLDAKAVKFNFERWSKYGVYHKGDFQTWNTYFGGFPGDILDTVEASDDGLNVTIKLKRPLASLLQILSMPQFGLVSPGAFDENGYFARPVGSGPYIAEKPVRGEVHYIVLKANPNYTVERDTNVVKPPVLNTIVALVLRPTQDGLAEIKRGTISATDKIRPEDMPNARNDATLNILYREPLNLAFLSMNQSRPPFNQREVRQAFTYAINVRNLASKYYNGLGQPASYFLPPAAYASLPGTPFTYDPERARQLLAVAGYAGGTGFPSLDLWTMPMPRSYYPDKAKIAEAIRADLALIGVNINIRSDKDWPSYREDRDQGKLSFFMNGWQGQNGDPDEFLGSFFGQTRVEDNYENIILQQLVSQGRQTLDLASRRQLYKSAQEVLAGDFAIIPLVYVQTPVALRPDLKDYVPHPSGVESWATVSFNQK